jgi:beta-N-acetylhexosaminidase
VDVPLDVLRNRDLPPFAAVVTAGTRAIMTAHIRVPVLTGDNPATFSRAALTDLLRREYGFTGTIVTDALEMKGASVIAGGPGRAAVRALAAGADLLCIGAQVDADLVEEVAAEIVAALGDGRLDRARVEAAAASAAALAAWTRTATPVHPVPTDLGYAAARRAVRVEGVLAGLDTPLVVQLLSASTIAEGRVPWGLGPHLNGTEQLPVVATETEAAALRELAGSRPIVLVGRHLHRLAGAAELVEALAAEHPVAVVEMGWPSSWRPAGARAFVTTYGASHANGRAAAEALGLAAAAH